MSSYISRPSIGNYNKVYYCPLYCLYTTDRTMPYRILRGAHIITELVIWLTVSIAIFVASSSSSFFINRQSWQLNWPNTHSITFGENPMKQVGDGEGMELGEAQR